MSTVKTDPIVVFLEHLLSGICRDRVLVSREGSQIYVSPSAREFGRVCGEKGKMWGAIKVVAYHAARLEKMDPPHLLLENPDERSAERDSIEFGDEWSREAFLEYVAPLIHAVAPGCPDAAFVTDDAGGARLRTAWDEEAKDRLSNVPAALGTILASAGAQVGARITLEVVWR